MKKYKIKIFFMGFFIIFTTILGLFYPYLTGKIIDSIYYLGEFNQVIRYSIIFLAFFIAHQIFRAAGTLNFIVLTTSLSFDIKKKLMEQICFGKFEEINLMESADLIKRVEEDSNSILNEIYYSKIYKLSDYVEFVVLLIFITFINPWYLLITVVMFPIYISINNHTEKILNILEIEFIKKNNKLINWIIELSDVIEALRDLGVKDYILKKTKNYNDNFFHSKEKKIKFIWTQKSLIQLLSILLRIMYMGVSFLLFKFKGLTLGQFVAVFAYMESAIEIFSDLNTQSNLTGRFTAEKQRIDEMLTLSLEPVGKAKLLDTRQRDSLKESLTVSNFSIYQNTNKILDNINTTFTSGELNILFGESGSGKSTLLMGLCGLLNYDGNIYFNHNMIEKKNIISYRDLVSFAHQNNYFFDETIRFNITLGNSKILDEEIYQLLEELDLKERIDLFRYGLDERLDNIKSNFSGGELRRLIIARAFLKKSRIFLLDEITAGLDMKNQKIVLDFLKKQSESKIVILCTHEKSIIQNGERLFNITKGRIIYEEFKQ